MDKELVEAVEMACRALDHQVKRGEPMQEDDCEYLRDRLTEQVLRLKPDADVTTRFSEGDEYSDEWE